jgi:hypothetical protein
MTRLLSNGALNNARAPSWLLTPGVAKFSDPPLSEPQGAGRGVDQGQARARRMPWGQVFGRPPAIPERAIRLYRSEVPPSGSGADEIAAPQPDRLPKESGC